MLPVECAIATAFCVDHTYNKLEVGLLHAKSPSLLSGLSAQKQEISPTHYNVQHAAMTSQLIIGDIKTLHDNLNIDDFILGDHLTSCSGSSVVNHPTPAHSCSPMFAVSFSPLTVVHCHHEPKQHSILHSSKLESVLLPFYASTQQIMEGLFWYMQLL